MSKYISHNDIIVHKQINRDWVNCFDPFSKNLTLNGILTNNQFWRRERPNQTKEETILIYGVNANKQTFSLRLKTKPIFDMKNKTLICIQYNYQIFFDTKQTQNHYKCNETGVSYNVSNNNNNCNEYKFPGLLLEVLEPFQRWRIRFNGFLRDRDNVKTFFSIRFLWFSNSEVFDFRANCDTNYLTKQTIGFQLTIDDIFEDRYVGCGQLKGVFSINNESEEQLFLWGSKSKAFGLGSNQQLRQNYEKSILMAYSEKGMAFEVIKITSKLNNKILHYGWGLVSHGSVFPIQDFIHDLNINCENRGNFVINFKIKINGKHLNVENLFKRYNGFYGMTINGHIGTGILISDNELFSEMKAIEPNMDSYKHFNVREETEELVLGFDNKISSNESISGGKGSSLCLLKGLSHLDNNQRFVVPNGFVVTTNAYKLFLNENPVLYKTIENLETILWSENLKNLINECEIVVNLFIKSEMPSEIKTSINNALKIFITNDNPMTTPVAVRSSACGEDSEDMSAAGQMTTYLGVKGLKSICESVIKCWSSQFNIIAVEYKRGYGQVVNSDMAVVVQEMVDCDVAGVMFTCDPLNGAPNKIVINANYGIGESVVSATVNPDNISLLVDMECNSFDGKRSVHSIDKLIIGAKESAIKMGETSGTVVKIKDTTEEKCCLTEEQIKSLAQIGLNIQNYFSSARDIEWGVRDGVFYVFQSRPVTNLNAYNEWELSHEFDTGHMDELEYNTRANVGEVMPGALSPLFITSLKRLMWLYVSVDFLRIHGLNYVPHRKNIQAVTFANNSAFFSLKDAMVLNFAPTDKEPFIHKALILAIFGHPVDDKQLRVDAYERNGVNTLMTKLWSQLNAFKNVFLSTRRLKAVMTTNEGLDLLKGYKYNNSKEMFKVLSENLYLMAEVFQSHYNCTTKSSTLNLILMSILSNGNIDVKTNPNLLTDFANLLSMSRNSIVSADVPSAIKLLANSIEKPQIFKQMSAEEALNWIENNNQKSGDLYKEFMKNYGMRGYKEWEVMSKTWFDNKLLLVKTIQQMLPLSENQSEVVITSDQLLDQMQSKLSRSQRLLLKYWILPACHRSIAEREASKLFNIKFMDKFRQFFREMAKMLCHREGRIPETDLIYFLTLHELKTLTEFRDSKIVMKAKQRKRIFPKLDKYIYNEFSIGPDIRPRNAIDKSVTKTVRFNENTILTGTPVCTGSVTAKVCVAKCFDDAINLESGDILVTYSTDIGWSPYLPMISGIITEIGGLVSHGAVIAREYGIPSIVGVNNACEVLSSGDTVLLDADNSQIVLLKHK